MARRASVDVPYDDVPTIEDVMHLIVKLPYLDAINLAAALHADVDKMVPGAIAFLDAAEAEREAARQKEKANG